MGHRPERRGRSGPSRPCRAVTVCLFDTLPSTEYHLTLVDRLDQQATSVMLSLFHPRYRGTPPKIESKHINLRTRIKRLVRRTLCFSKTEQMHDLVIGLFINRYEFGRAF